nr:diacylglycerol kinase family protein [Heliorestis convoluta]
MKGRKLIFSFFYAIRGIWKAIQEEQNLKIHLATTVVVIFLTFYFAIDGWERAWIILSTFLVLSAEMFNTAIEAVVDRGGQAYHPLAELAKDAAAGAVLLLAIQAIIAGITVFGPRVLALW